MEVSEYSETETGPNFHSGDPTKHPYCSLKAGGIECVVRQSMAVRKFWENVVIIIIKK